MLIFWVTFGIIDLLIIFFFILLCIISLRQAPNDIRKHEFQEGSQLDRLQKEILKDECFFDTHPKQEISIQNDGLVLYADRFIQKHPRGRILLFHGYRSMAETDFACVMESYYSAGFELILIDQRAHGKSAGNWIGFGVTERKDCLSWIEYLNQQFGAIPSYLCGISMGASTVLMATGQPLPSNIRGVIADCGFTSPKEIIAYIMKRKLHLPSRLLLPILSCFSKLFAGYFFGEYSVAEAMKSNALPILFIHGKADRFVPPEMTIQNYDACQSEKKLILVDGAGHGTAFLQDRETVEKEILDFLNAHLSDA